MKKMKIDSEIIDLVSAPYDEKIEDLRIIRRTVDNQINRWKKEKKKKIKWLKDYLENRIPVKVVYEVGAHQIKEQ